MPYQLSSEAYPLAQEPSPDDLKVFGLDLGGRRVLVQENGYKSMGTEALSGPGWTRTLFGGMSPQAEGEKMDLLGALVKSKGKEMRKRPHDSGRLANGEKEKPQAPTPPFTADGPDERQRSCHPRKKIRGLDEVPGAHEGSNAPLSPLPSPEHEDGPSTASSSSNIAQPSVGMGIELAALFSLPSIVSHFEILPDKLQQQVLLQLLRRSRMPTIQRVASFASVALKRDFISLLPHEVAIHILKKVDTHSLVAATRVSKKWRKIIDSERVIWRQRLIDDDMWVGLGVEKQEEDLVERRMDVLDSLAREKPSKAGTPIEDEEMLSAVSNALDIERPTALKHVYRRRYTSNHNWFKTKPVHTSFPGHGTNVVTCLQFDADKIVSASDDHSINVYNTSNGQLRRRLNGHEGGVWALEYKGDTLVSGSTDRTIRIWDLESLSEAHVFHGHTSTVRCLQIVEPVMDPTTGEYQPPCPMIVTGSRDASLRVWKLPKKGEPPITRSKVSCSLLSIDIQKLIRLRVLQKDDPESTLPPEENPWHVHHLEGHTLAVRALAAYGRTCVSGSYDCSVRVWDIVTGQCKQILRGHEQKSESNHVRIVRGLGLQSTALCTIDIATAALLALWIIQSKYGASLQESAFTPLQDTLPSLDCLVSPLTTSYLPPPTLLFASGTVIRPS